MLNFLIRPARGSDTLAISTLILSGSQDAVGAEGTEDELNNWRNSIANSNLINRKMQEPNTKLLIAEGQVSHSPIGLIGTGYATIDEMGEAHIAGIFVSVKRAGAATRVISALVDWLKINKVAIVHMSISHENAPMKALAEKYGFKKTASDSGVYFVNGTFETWSANISNLTLPAFVPSDTE